MKPDKKTYAPKQYELMTIQEVCKSLNVSRGWLYQAEKMGKYPPGKRYSKRIVRFRKDLHELYLAGTWP